MFVRACQTWYVGSPRLGSPLKSSQCLPWPLLRACNCPRTLCLRARPWCHRTMIQVIHSVSTDCFFFTISSVADVLPGAQYHDPLKNFMLTRLSLLDVLLLGCCQAGYTALLVFWLFGCDEKNASFGSLNGRSKNSTWQHSKLFFLSIVSLVTEVTSTACQTEGYMC